MAATQRNKKSRWREHGSETVAAPPTAAFRWSSRWALPATVMLLVIVGGAIWLWLAHGWRDVVGAGGREEAAAFVGSETCAGCHQPEAQRWRGSQHQRAMAHANDRTVLGDFNNASFSHFGQQSRFFRRDGRFLVETDGPDGRLATFEVRYTFGVDPLQQYLIELPDGRVQALSIAWDSRPKDRGGQRWFHLYPNEEIKHDDVLHWTRPSQNWNFMCAECHSTGVRKNYDSATDRFATTWAEISVGCEACHGRGSAHVAWAQARQRWWWPFGRSDDPKMGLAVRFDERRDISWPIDARTGNARRSFTPALVRKEVETCGLCHARRGTLSEDWNPGRWLSNTHSVTSLARGLYHADGQMLDEVYNYGSFKQSRMFAAGVTCSDCHEPHAATLRADPYPTLPQHQRGDARLRHAMRGRDREGVCLQCHAGDRYATASHHRHDGVDPPPTCASCHMPARTYMVIDRRHDHGFRVPRPDLSAKLGTPNACNDCHTDKSAQWAADAIERWHGGARTGWQRYAEAFHSAWSDAADAATLLATVARDGNTPAFARAGALSELAAHVSPANLDVARAALSDPDPMVRIGGLDMLERLPPAQTWPLAAPLLRDSSRGVRIRAAALLAAVPTANQPASDRASFEHAAAELVAAQQLNADRPEARATLGNFYARRGRAAEAEAEYKAGLRLSPHYVPAAVNLADLYRQIGRDSDGEAVLRQAISTSPRDAGLHHALGLALTRLKRSEEALAELRLAAELAPEHARYAYVHAVALHSSGHRPEAIAALRANLGRYPADRETLVALVSYLREAGDLKSALEYAERLAAIAPQDAAVTALVKDLRGRIDRLTPPTPP